MDQKVSDAKVIFRGVLVISELVLRDKNFGISSNRAKRYLNNEEIRCSWVFFQHDAYSQPYKTIGMMRRENNLGIVSLFFLLLTQCLR